MYGIGCCDSAWKKRTSLRSSLSENENVGMRTCRYGRTPLRLVSVVLSDGFDRNFRSHSGSTRAPSVRSFGGSCSCIDPDSASCLIRIVLWSGMNWWQPMQLYFLTTHQPS